MNDLISRQAAIDAIDDIESEVEDGDGFQYAKWREYFCELPPAQPEQWWIPVSERLPEEFQCVLVTTGSRVDVCTYLKGSAYWKSYVLAWIPLPQPAKLED